MKIKEFKSYIVSLGFFRTIYCNFNNNLVFPVNFSEKELDDFYDEGNHRFIINCSNAPNGYELRVHRLIECVKKYNSFWDVYFQYEDYDPIRVSTVFFDRDLNAVIIA